MIRALAGDRTPTAAPNGGSRWFPREDASMKTTPTRPRQPPCRPPCRPLGPPAFAGLEPELREILADPIVRTLMARDGVGIGDIRYLVDLVGRRCSRPPPIAAAGRPGDGGSAVGAPVPVGA